MAVSVNQELNNTSLDEPTRKALQHILQAMLQFLQDESASLDADAGVTATDAVTRLNLLIKD